MNVQAVDISGVQKSPSNVAASLRQDPSLKEKVAEDAAASKEQVRRMVNEMQVQINRMSVSLQFYTYGEHGENIAVVVADKDTGQVIREIPSKEIQDLYAKMNELAGMIFNRQV